MLSKLKTRIWAMNFTKYGKVIDESLSPFQRLMMYALQARINQNSVVNLKMVQRELEVYTKGKPSNKFYHGIRRYMVSGITYSDVDSLARYIHSYFTLRTKQDDSDNTVVLILLLVGCRHKRLIDRLVSACTTNKISDDSFVSIDSLKEFVTNKIVELDTKEYSKIIKRLTFYRYANIVEKRVMSELIG